MVKDIYLCITAPESGRPLVKAVYDDETEALAWQEGVEAAYGTGYVMYATSNQGALNIDDWFAEAKKAE